MACETPPGAVERSRMSGKITCVIPVYNGQAFLLQTLQSVAVQTFKPDRIIVLDDWSTDETPRIVQGFDGAIVEYIRNPERLGLFGNCNRALEFAV